LPGTLFAAFDQILIFAFYARQNTKAPQIVGVIAVGVYLAFALSLYQPYGMVGLVVANSAQFIFHTIVMIWLLRRYLAGAPLDGGQLKRTLKICAIAALLMALLAGGLAFLLDMALPGLDGLAGLLRDGLIVAVPAAAGAAVYGLLLLRARIDEAELIRARVLALARR
jgi:putative peptidoglycan lipid II flippase